MKHIYSGIIAIGVVSLALAGCTTSEEANPTTVTTAAAANVAEAKTWQGIWDDNRQWTSTLEFLEGKQLIYCFRSECTQASYRGDPRGTVRFSWGSARFAFKWTGDGYQGTRRAGDVTNSGLLK